MGRERPAQKASAEPCSADALTPNSASIASSSTTTPRSPHDAAICCSDDGAALPGEKSVSTSQYLRADRVRVVWMRVWGMRCACAYEERESE
jgi:hypothetical protein